MPDYNTILPIDADEKFAIASAEGVPPYNWIPPVKPPLQITQHARKPFLDTNLPPCDVLRAMDPEGKANEEHLAKKDANLKKIPHPFSRFVHLDPPPPNEAALKKLPLRDVETYRRLGLTFNLIVCRTVELLTAINDAVKSGDLKQYQDARDAYMEFIRNLDNHEPKGQAVNPKLVLGYGRNLKWTYVDPIIRFDTDAQCNLIIGTAIMAEWNPHLSSSGVPIPH